MVSLHAHSDKPQTKLTILQHAVNIITSLESQVRGMTTCYLHIIDDDNAYLSLLILMMMMMMMMMRSMNMRRKS